MFFLKITAAGILAAGIVGVAKWVYNRFMAEKIVEKKDKAAEVLFSAVCSKAPAGGPPIEGEFEEVEPNMDRPVTQQAIQEKAQGRSKNQTRRK